MEENEAPVHLEEYNPSWPEMFLTEQQHLKSLIGDYLKGSVEHIGSTAVPGLVAKPVIDTMFGVESLQSSRPVIEILKTAGYSYSPYKGEIMHWFCKPSFSFRTHHLHIVPFESPLWFERIRFRDCLRTSPNTASRYADLKRKLARDFERDRDTYTEKKWPFINSILKSMIE